MILYPKVLNMGFIIASPTNRNIGKLFKHLQSFFNFSNILKILLPNSSVIFNALKPDFNNLNNRKSRSTFEKEKT